MIFGKTQSQGSETEGKLSETGKGKTQTQGDMLPTCLLF